MEDIGNWSKLNIQLMMLTEKECQKLLDAERKARNRPSVLLRIYGRLAVLRREREIKELFAPEKEPAPYVAKIKKGFKK